MEQVALQMFSVAAQAREDFTGTLALAAEAGYTGIEFAMNYYGGLEPKVLAGVMKSAGLRPLSTHVPLDRMEETLPYGVALEMRYFVVPTHDFYTCDGAMALADRLNGAGELCRRNGLHLAYHNHGFEFLRAGGDTLYELLLQNTDPALVSFQLDAGWAANAGADCPALIRRHAGRFSSIHVRECGRVDGPARQEDVSGVPVDENGMFLFTEEQKLRRYQRRSWNVRMGEGIVPWREVVAAANDQGADTYIVEREIFQGQAFACLAHDCRFLREL